MTDRRLRLLIAEKEYLIAIDAKEILGAMLACDVMACGMHELEQHLRDNTWDGILIDVAPDPDASRRNAGMALATGAGLVFLTGYTDLAKGVPGFEEWPVVIKPFTDAALFDALLRALALVGKV